MRRTFLIGSLCHEWTSRYPPFRIQFYVWSGTDFLLVAALELQKIHDAHASFFDPLCMICQRLRTLILCKLLLALISWRSQLIAWDLFRVSDISPLWNIICQLIWIIFALYGCSPPHISWERGFFPLIE